jgi:hypothetical protein
MRVIILKNKFTTSLTNKIKRIKEFYKDLDLDITEKNIKLDIANGDYNYIDQYGKLQTYKAVDETWYDENISKPYKAQGYDIAILILREKDWVSSIVEGFGTSIPDYGIEEIALAYYKNGIYNFNGVQLVGDKTTWIIIHELMHRIYHIKGLEDNTHKYFLEGKPERCLEDFNNMKTAILTRQKSGYKETLGELKCYNQGNEFSCKTLELPWLNNQKNISCIPTGVYKVKMIYSLKYGRVYEVQDVKGRSSIYFHEGNYYSQIKGCILVGNKFSDINGDGELDVVNSKITRKALEAFFGYKDFILVIK